jgi:hypothetical protein
MTDATKGESSAQTGPSKVLNNVPGSRNDLEVTGAPNDEAKLRKTLKGALSQGNQATYSRGGR